MSEKSNKKIYSESDINYILKNILINIIGDMPPSLTIGEVIENLSVNLQQEIKDNIYTLPIATASILGGIKVGSSLSVTPDGILDTILNETTLPIATKTVLGAVKLSRNFITDANGVLEYRRIVDGNSYDYNILSANEITKEQVFSARGDWITDLPALSGYYTVDAKMVNNEITKTNQLAIGNTDGKMYFRTQVDSIWNPWKRVITDDMPATASILGGIKVGSNLTITPDGTLSAVVNQYSLPIATASILGGIKVGSNLTITPEGILNINIVNDLNSTLTNASLSANMGKQLGDSKFNKTGGEITGSTSVANYGTGELTLGIKDDAASQLYMYNNDTTHGIYDTTPGGGGTIYSRNKTTGVVASNIFTLKSGDTSLTGNQRTTGEYQSTHVNSYRSIQGNYGTFWHQNGTDLYLMFTNSGDQYGSYNSLRPFRVTIATGVVNFGHNVSVTGTVTATTDLVISSDERIKSDIIKIDDATNIINQINGYRYLKQDKKSVGVIAQEIEKILPELVYEIDDTFTPEGEEKITDLKGVSYNGLSAVLIEALKETNARVKLLEDEIKSLHVPIYIKIFNKLKSFFIN